MAPSRFESVPVHNHLRLVTGLCACKSRIDVQFLRPRVIRPEFKAAAQAASYIRLQRVVTGVAFCVPEESTGQIRIRARSNRYVLAPSLTVLRAVPVPPARQPAALRTDLRRNAIGIDTDQSVISE